MVIKFFLFLDFNACKFWKVCQKYELKISVFIMANMAWKKRFTKSTRRSTRSKKFSSKRSLKPSKSLVRVVKRIVARKLETKLIQSFCVNANGDSFPIDAGGYSSVSGAWTSTNILDQAMVQGTGQGQRVGNSIELKSCNLHVMITSILNVGITAAGTYHFILCKNKNTNGLPGNTDLLRLGAGVDTAHNGDWFSSMLPFQEDTNTIYCHKQHRVCEISPVDAAANIVDSINNNARNVWKFTINLLKYVPKKLQFDNNTTGPTNAHIYAIMWFVPDDDNNIVTNQIGTGLMSLTTKYKDA
nr:MAG: capsid protein [Cressdnaviricota sp.]